MPIARQGRFLLSADLAHVPCIGLESRMLAACVKEAREKKIKGVFGSPGFGFKERTLDALRELPALEAVWFWDVALSDAEALYELPALRFFGVHPKRPALDFARLPELRSLVWFHQPADRGVEALRRLERLHVWRFQPKSKSFAGLLLPRKLPALQILWANPATLEGLAPLPGLQRLEIHRCRNLESLALLPDLFPNLRHLVVDTCGRVPKGEGERIAARLPKLEHAFVQHGKVV